MSDQDWTAKAKENADFHAAALARAQERQAKAGGELLADFVAKARASGVPAQEMTARPYRGNGRYRTGIRGWYLLPDRSLGVDEQGRFFILSCPPMDLSDVLAKRLAAGPSHP